MMITSNLFLEPLTRDLPKNGCRVSAICKILEEQGIMESSEYERFKVHSISSQFQMDRSDYAGVNGKFEPGTRKETSSNLSHTADTQIQATTLNRMARIRFESQ